MSDPSSSSPAAQPSIEELLAAKLSITSYSIHGVNRTKEKLIHKVLQPVLSTGGDFEGVINDVSTAVDRLRSTNCYKGIDAFIDHQHDKTASVRFTFTEKSSVQLTTGTSIDTSSERDASMDGTLSLRNLLGAADTLRFTLSWIGATSTSRSFSKNPSNSCSAAYVRPFVLGLNSSMFSNVSYSQLNHSEASSYNLVTRLADCGLHTVLGTFTLASVWRNLTHVQPTASSLIRDDAKDSWKTSLRHHVEIDMRDDMVMPNQGIFASLTHEHTLPIGDIRLSTVETAFQSHFPLIADAVLSFSSRLGTHFSSSRVQTPDRFFIGGANSLRGFKTRGVGPMDGKDSIGGDVFYTSSLMLSLPMPANSLLSQLFNARLHMFLNGGDVFEMTDMKEAIGDLKGTGLQEAVRKAFDGIYGGLRVAAGVGVAFDTSVGRVELNLCNVFKSSVSDQPQIGFQFGVSQSFL
ncbi:Surface antigen D15-like protein [Gracilaria domingensis]|nr:Surface antigen D15-like protein [Gracilaria domingensis]